MSAPVTLRNSLEISTQSPTWRWFGRGFGLLAMLALGGCESIGYYAHVAGGQWQLLSAREPVAEVIAELDANPDQEGSRVLKTRLQQSQRVLDFAEQELGLKVGGRYRSYVALDRSAVVWNLFAARQLSLEAHTWCYPFVGCAPYRGYFARDRLEESRRRLDKKGLDTYVGSVTAYSTLGWFDDPLLSTFIDQEEGEFVELLFHELAHSRIWVKDDATFNESFASFVGQEGLRSWFEAAGRHADFDRHLAKQGAWEAARKMLEKTRDALLAAYTDVVTDRVKLARKVEIIESAGACLERYADATGVAGYRRLVPRLNNAYLASLATYSDAVPGFAVLFRQVGTDWPAFYARVEELGDLPKDARWQALAQLSEHHVTAEGKDQSPDEIQCESLSGHGFNTEAASAQHDHIGRSRDR